MSSAQNITGTGSEPRIPGSKKKSDPGFRLPKDTAVERCSRALGENLSDVRDRSIKGTEFDIQPRELLYGSKTGDPMWMVAQSAFTTDVDMSDLSAVSKKLRADLPEFLGQNPAWAGLESEIIEVIKSACIEGDVIDGRKTLILTQAEQDKHGFSDEAIRAFIHFVEAAGVHQIIIESFEGQHDLIIVVYPDGRKELNIVSGSMLNYSKGNNYGQDLYLKGGGYQDHMVKAENIAQVLDMTAQSTRRNPDTPSGEEHVMWTRMSHDDKAGINMFENARLALNYVRNFIGEDNTAVEKFFPTASLSEFWDPSSGEQVSFENLGPIYGAGVPPHIRRAFLNLPGLSSAPAMPKADRRERPMIIFEEPGDATTLSSEPWNTQKLAGAMSSIAMHMPGDSYPIDRELYEVYKDRYKD